MIVLRFFEWIAQCTINFGGGRREHAGARQCSRRSVEDGCAVVQFQRRGSNICFEESRAVEVLDAKLG